MTICPLRWPELSATGADATGADITTKMRIRLGSFVSFAISLTLLGGCAEKYEGTAYATVPVQTFAAPNGVFEVLDRRDIERLVIRKVSDCQERTSGGHSPAPLKAGVLPPACPSAWNTVAKFATGLVAKISFERREIEWTGSAFVVPLETYFANGGRNCSVLRGHPLEGAQWEFVYTCQPGSDPTRVIWGPNGYSQLWPR